MFHKTTFGSSTEQKSASPKDWNVCWRISPDASSKRSKVSQNDIKDGDRIAGMYLSYFEMNIAIEKRLCWVLRQKRCVRQCKLEKHAIVQHACECVQCDAALPRLLYEWQLACACNDKISFAFAFNECNVVCMQSLLCSHAVTAYTRRDVDPGWGWDP